MLQSDEVREVLIEDARIMWPNFSGTETPMNAEGDRNFCVMLDEDVARDMERWGWNIKRRQAREDGDSEYPYVQVTVGYKIRPPQVWMVTKRGRTHLNEDMVGLLDEVEFKLVDIIIRGVPWNRHGRSGIKVYLKTGFFTIDEDYLQEKYADIPESTG